MNKAIALAFITLTAGAALADPGARPAKAGDVHVYSVEQRAERLRHEEVVTVEAAEGGQLKTRHVRSDRGAPLEGLYGADWSVATSGTSGAHYEPAIRMLPATLQVGSSWEDISQLRAANGSLSRLKLESKVAAREKTKTPAGEFDTFRIESSGYLSGLSWQGGFALTQKVWYAPAIDRIVRTEYREQRALGADNVTELTQFRPAD